MCARTTDSAELLRVTRLIKNAQPIFFYDFSCSRNCRNCLVCSDIYWLFLSRFFKRYTSIRKFYLVMEVGVRAVVRELYNVTKLISKTAILSGHFLTSFNLDRYRLISALINRAFLCTLHGSAVFGSTGKFELFNFQVKS